MTKFEKLSDYKRALKGFIRGAIKSKIFVTEAGKLPVSVAKCECDECGKVVTVTIDNDTYAATFKAEVATRIFNKVTPELYAPIEKQFNKLKNFGGLEISFED